MSRMSGAGKPTGQAGRFTTGSTMRHVATMTITSSIGLTFMFSVDFATLFYVSLLGNEALTAGVGLAWAVQFFTISFGIGLAIAATALVSRAIGERRRDRARRMSTAAMIYTTVLLITISSIVLFNTELVLNWLNATGKSKEVADAFLSISLPSLPFVGIAMITSSVLRAEGDARRAMFVTMFGGVAAMILDPLFIFAMDLGVDGAAYAMVLSRIISCSIGLYFVIRAHDLCAWPSLESLRACGRPFIMIAAPAMMTQLSTPFGNYLLTRWVAEFGDSAIAGWAVSSRLTVLAFGGIFALSGAIGGIIGQNYGARLADRVGRAYRDSMIFAFIYIMAAWAILAASAPWIIHWFNIEGVGADVIRAFCYVGAGGFLFSGGLFVANASFNNLGKPLWSTGFNWARDGLVIPILIFAAGTTLGAPGVVYVQAAAGVLIGGVAVIFGWRLAHSVRFDECEPPEWKSVPTGPTSARAAQAILGNEVERD
ncbi:MAG: MATE family efflux transporter [Pikeienuella sp.]